MKHESTSEQAERLSQKSARALPFLAGLFIAQQASFFLGTGLGTGDQAIHNVQVISWLALSAMMVVLLTTGGGWNYPREVRELANDESTRAHRDAALRVGFIASMVTCIVIYVVSLGEPVRAREAVHLIMSIGIASSLVRFGFLERRALKDG